LFGYRRGAFTGALRDKIGFFEAANAGTLFLDEISVLPMAVQSSLLRAVEEKSVVPLGDTHTRPIDLRIIAASNHDLEAMVRKGEFREDLLYRLNVVKLTLPPLRSRKEDIPLLVHHFLSKYSEGMNKRVNGITNSAMRALLNHEWHGNVRELENVIERAVIFADDRPVSVEDLPFAGPEMTDDVSEDLKEALRQFERQHIIHCLRRHQYDKVETAKHLGIGVSSLYRKMDELDVPKNLDEECDTLPPMPEPPGE
jgi:transcriptional regulator with PAS, ATPase and Fis domain